MTDQATTIADKALRAMKEAEELKKAAIQELIKQRDDIENKLQELGNRDIAGKLKSEQKKPCKVCGSLEHDGRFHSKRKRARQLDTEPIPIST